MYCKVVTTDGLMFTGERTWWMKYHETSGFHHFRVTKCPDKPDIVNKKIAIPISSIKYLVMED